MNKTYQRINWQNEPSIATPLNEVNLNKVDYSLNEVDNRVISLDTSKANQSDLLQSLKTVAYNDTTGVFTFTFWNGNTVTVDLNIEKIPVSFSMSPQGVITMTTADGTQYTADVASLIKTYSFTDSSEIDFTVTTDASGNKTVTASLVTGSITGDKLQPNYLADCVSAKQNAELAAGSASGSATSAGVSADDAEAWAVGTRDGSPVPSTDPAYNNNSKYWAEHTSSSFAGLSDTDFSNLQNGQVPVYNSTSGKWENGSGGGSIALNNLTDVEITTPSDGQFLKYNSSDSEWQNVTVIDDLTTSASKVWSSDKTNTEIGKKEDAATILTATLAAGSTSLTFTDTSIGNNSRISIKSNPFVLGLVQDATQSGTTVTLTCAEQASAISVMLEVRN